jgi:diacylglycerol kinase (ATP)
MDLSEQDIPHMAARFKKVEVIINPAAGNNEPMLNLINDAFKDQPFDWDVSITKRNGDGARHAKNAVRRGCDLVVAYGGDGTLLDVVSGMVGAKVPLALLPGGTANALCDEMGVPQSTVEALKVVTDEHSKVRAIDVGKVGKRHFMLRIGSGLIGAYSTAVDRDLKDRYGLFAYFIGTVRAVAQPQVTHYRLQIDDQKIELDALAILITNGNSTGGGSGVNLSPYVKIDDGLLDVFALKGELSSLVGMVGNVVHIERLAQSADHWQGRTIKVSGSPKIAFYADGEEEAVGKTPITATLLPEAVNILVPAKK